MDAGGDGIPADSRAAEGRFLTPEGVTPQVLAFVGELSKLAAARGQSVAQLALAWALRDPRVTSVLVGASRLEQLESNVAAVDRLDFTAEELAAIELAEELGFDGVRLAEHHFRDSGVVPDSPTCCATSAAPGRCRWRR